jgi:hypothetical protein
MSLHPGSSRPNRKPYQSEPTKLRQFILGQGYATPQQLMRIAAWKSAISLANLSLNNEADIYCWTRQACLLGRPLLDEDVLRPTATFSWPAWEQTTRKIMGMNRQRAKRANCDASGLLALEGVDYPVGTAFLAILNPKCWPVMDRWSLQTVFNPSTGTRIVPQLM